MKTTFCVYSHTLGCGIKRNSVFWDNNRFSGFFQVSMTRKRLAGFSRQSFLDYGYYPVWCSKSSTPRIHIVSGSGRLHMAIQLCCSLVLNTCVHHALNMPPLCHAKNLPETHGLSLENMIFY